MPSPIPKSIRVTLLAAGIIFGLLILAIGSVIGTSWYLGHEAFAYTWDHTVENTTGVAANHFDSDGLHRGVAVKGLSNPDFAQAIRDNVEWVAVTPFGWQRGLNTPDVFMSDDVEGWAPTDDEIRGAVVDAHKVGLHVFLKPHLWVVEGRGWRSDISMVTQDEWAQWFRSYTTFIMHHARIADSAGVEMFCVGTELRETTAHEAEWRKLIAAVRAVYRGQLIYAANWDAFEDVPFWDALDAIGIQAYFPLIETSLPSLGKLITAWDPHVQQIERVSKRFDRQVIFTEVGYRSVVKPAIRPWEWGELFFFERVSTEAQANCYEALFETFWEKEWFGGMYVWTWYPRADARSGYFGRGFTPQEKPAENVMGRWYAGAGE